MQIAVISDLHLNAIKDLNGFGHDDSFLRFLTFLEANFERIVLLGDIWETLTGPFPCSATQQLKAAFQAHPEVYRRFSSPKYTYIHGNHDLIAGKAVGAPEHILLNQDGTGILFTHGHQGDILTNNFRWVSELGVWIGGLIRRVGLKRAYQIIADWDGFDGGASLDGSRCKFQSWATMQAHEARADIVVTGHTHIATVAEKGSKLFMNSGSCDESRLNFLSLDTKASKYLVHTSY